MKQLKIFALIAICLLTACQGNDDVTPELDLSQTEFQLGYESESVSMDVTSNYLWTIEQLSGQDWCSYAVEGDAVKFTAAANNGASPREADFKVVSSDLTKQVKIIQTVYTLPEDFSDLSAQGTANCYIVAPGSKVYFNASVKGNSTESLEGVADTKLVWQSDKDLVTFLKYVPAVKSIAVETGSAKGNALVAAVNAAGEVAWSWHLWITDYAPEATLFSTPANAAGTVWKFMDRNLGALSNKPEGFDSHGLLYQWGRKDPFPGATSYTDQDPYTYVYYDGKDGEPVFYDFNNQELPKCSAKAAKNGSVELAVKNPDVFYLNLKIDTGKTDEYGDKIYDQGDWGKPTDDDAWGGISMKKTINDPCPVGYKVPVSDASGNTPYAWLKYASMTWDKTNYGAVQDGQWFPATGTRVYEGGGLDFPDPADGGNPYSGIWFGTIGSASEYNHYGQYMFIINGKRTFKCSKDSRSQGMSLRCVAE